MDDCGYVALLKPYLARADYTAGPLLRASIDGCGGPLPYARSPSAARPARYRG
ncbi:hypothetical protein ACQP2T_30935 [Nonomuraea sp. CA-143628]|uniref:hypothetical protein n=1 Tax=Nonomuraea sp. CA-143628 TaxID=3239997 RepID=UPI003D8FF11A